MPSIDADKHMLQAMGQFQDFLSTEETMDRLTRALSFRLQREGKMKAAIASASEPVVESDLCVEKVSQGTPTKLPGKVFGGTVCRSGRGEAQKDTPGSTPATHSEVVSRLGESVTSEDWMIASDVHDDATRVTSADAEATQQVASIGDLFEEISEMQIGDEGVREDSTASLLQRMQDKKDLCFAEEVARAVVDGDADMDDISERKASSVARPCFMQVRAPRPSPQLRLHAKLGGASDAAPAPGNLSADVWWLTLQKALADQDNQSPEPDSPQEIQSFSRQQIADWARRNQAQRDMEFGSAGAGANIPSSSSTAAPRATAQAPTPALGPSASLWRQKGLQGNNASPMSESAKTPALHGSKPGRIHGAPLPGRPEGFEVLNPYVKALRAHREELLRNTIDLQEMRVDSLAARLSTERHDALATLNISQTHPEGLDVNSDFRFRCGPEPCGETSAELEEVLLQSSPRCYPEASFRMLRRDQLDNEILQNPYLLPRAAHETSQGPPGRENSWSLEEMDRAHETAGGIPLRAFRMRERGDNMSSKAHDEDTADDLHNVLSDLHRVGAH